MSAMTGSPKKAMKGHQQNRDKNWRKAQKCAGQRSVSGKQSLISLFGSLGSAFLIVSQKLTPHTAGKAVACNSRQKGTKQTKPHHRNQIGFQSNAFVERVGCCDRTGRRRQKALGDVKPKRKRQGAGHTGFLRAANQ